MRSKLFASTFTIVLGLATSIVSAIVLPDAVVAQTVTQTVEGKKEETDAFRASEAERLFRQGREQHEISQFTSAVQSLQQALTLYREIKDRQGEAKTLGLLGNAYDSP